ncbi:MAG: CoA-binding protein [Deltaproteobacteria bacterium]|nr:CoA-binding protein [Deltaproteobacteria bacterium]MBW1923776.1 CoA-binding protein [Deltaproteobacteria bacterium]MBW1949033.1 CoA-binding protein [Deltaproteobacteria bacterium]MBW2009221.1 CoA-binding protein [Deltaproteobacteria bacterium]MBW2103463.1 CoA-binding protein [Deltaproteobacteria bacterium]
MTASSNAKPEMVPLFDPKGIALIGASANPNKWGFRILANLIVGGFEGPLYPVNPNGGEILGIRVYPSIKKIPPDADLGIVTVPAIKVCDILKECAGIGLRSLIIISSGFSETGSRGEALENELGRCARRENMRLIGPNTMGVYSSKCNLHALMPPLQPKIGGASYVSQSGNLGVQMLSWGRERGVGFCKFVSSGNELDLRCEDFLEYFAEDPESKVIIAYIEGLDDGIGFLQAAGTASGKKPVIVFKGGKTEDGGRAAKSHSGALAGSYSVYTAAFRQSGVIEAESTDAMLDFTTAFLHFPLPRGNRIVIMTRGGGWGVVCADACRKSGLRLVSLSERIISRLNQVLPSYWSHGNPIDFAATLNPEAFPNCLEELIKINDVDGIIALGMEYGDRTKYLADKLKSMNRLGDIDLREERGGASDIELALDLMDAYQKPVIMVSGVSSHTKAVSINGRETVLYSSPENAARAMAALWRYSHFLLKTKAM